LRDPHRALEMGQGTLTGLAQLVAEELECDWKKSRPSTSFPGRTRRKRVWGDMATGGSRGIRGSQDYVRRGGARRHHARAGRAAMEVPVGELTVADGVITHAASSAARPTAKVRSAAKLTRHPIRRGIKLKDRRLEDRRQTMKRLDTADKLNGSKLYAIDLKMPGMLNACVQACPVHGGKLVSYDEAKVREHAGRAPRRQVNDGAVAVVADTWWRAKTALEARPSSGTKAATRAIERDDRRALEGRPDGETTRLPICRSATPPR